MSRGRVYKWLRRFLNDDAGPGHRHRENRVELVQKFREIIAIDRNFTVRMLAEELNTNRETAAQILTIELGKRKVLNEDQEIDMTRTIENYSDFLDSTISSDETWCLKYDRKSKNQLAQWRSKGK
ncbi:hypothetical protein Trydic_g13405 [Trypoxylus dichotomus]